MQEEREEVEEKEEEREERSDDFLSGTSGLGLPSPRHLVLGREETEGDRGTDCEVERGDAGWRGKAVRGEEGATGEDTGVPGVGVLDWLE